ncbi:hypothetical protein [Streptomyces wedmorensis]|uniref:hypothetical protein n=1 Tax=Streptomyces wedmorensis TaxID=43759 RepID=UPI0037B36DC0
MSPWNIPDDEAFDDDTDARARKIAEEAGVPPQGAAPDADEAFAKAQEDAEEPVEAKTTGEEKRKAVPRLFADLRSVLDGTYQPAKPVVGQVFSEVGMFYPGTDNLLYGDSEACKTLVALYAAVVEMGEGHHVVMFDFESHSVEIVHRLRALGGEPDQILELFHYASPDCPLTQVELAELGRVLAMDTTLVIIDSVTAAMTLYGFDPLSGTDYEKWLNTLARPITRCKEDSSATPAVVQIDHVVKAADAGKRYTIGTERKISGCTGVAYLLIAQSRLSPGRKVNVRVFVSKDKPAQVRKYGVWDAQMRVDFLGAICLDASSSRYIDVTAELADDAETVEHQAESDLQARIWFVLREHPQGLSQSEVEVRIKGASNVDKRYALAALVDAGFVAVKLGPRNAKQHLLTDVIPEWAEVPDPWAFTKEDDAEDRTPPDPAGPRRGGVSEEESKPDSSTTTTPPGPPGPKGAGSQAGSSGGVGSDEGVVEEEGTPPPTPAGTPTPPTLIRQPTGDAKRARPRRRPAPSEPDTSEAADNIPGPTETASEPEPPVNELFQR